jgi:integrase
VREGFYACFTENKGEIHVAQTKQRSASSAPFNFTQRSILARPVPERGRATYHDTQVRELGLMIYPTGRRTFFWFRRARGNRSGTHFTTIGPFPDISIEQARGKASELSGQLARAKMDEYRDGNPFGRNRDDLTFSELLDAYCERHIRTRAKNPALTEKRMKNWADFYLKHWKGRKLSSITRAEVLEVFNDLGKKHKHTANQTVRHLRLLFNFALAAELWRGENPATRIPLFHEAKRARFVQPDELPRLFAALKTEPNSDLIDFVNLALWTGARKADVFSMRWDCVFLADNRWDIPNPKSQKPYSVPLTPEAVKILKDRQSKRIASSPWVFPSHSQSGHVEDLHGRWKELLKRAKITNLRVHDLRRTQGSWQAAQGTPLLVIGKSLGHSTTAATEVYARLDLEPVRNAMTSANAAMAAAMKKKSKTLPDGISRS